MFNNSGFTFSIAILLLLTAIPTAAQTAPDSTPADAPPTLRAVHATDEIAIDGRLNEAVWETAPVATGFIQREPNPGAPATRRTEVRVLYGESAIYVGARMYDDPDSISAQLSRRDELDTDHSDVFAVGFDSYNDNRTAFVFAVNPRGVKRDSRLSEDAGEDDSWDAVWEVRTAVDSLGWTAEFRIPLSQLRYSADETVWGVNFQRVIARLAETSFWAPIPPDSPGIVSEFGTLTGLEALGSPTRLELQPYVVSRLTRAPPESGNPFYSANQFSSSAGLDLQYGLTSNLTLTGTINPDFGQVEADPSEVNLSAFETFFPERRPFFVEGSDIFDYPVSPEFGQDQLFYSRRIGREPQRSVRIPNAYINAPDATTIFGAAKVSGKTADGWSIGFLDALTAEEVTRVSLATGDTTIPVEPLTNYAVARIAKDFRDGLSTVGGVFTATNRRLDEGSGLRFLNSAAYAGGLDGRHRFGGGNYEVSGQILGSHVRGSTEAISRIQRSPVHYFQRPGIDHIEFDSTRTTLSGVSINALLAKIGGGNWRWGMGTSVRSPGFEVNDLGFQRDADLIVGGGFVGYQQFEPGRVFRRWNATANLFSGWTFGGERFTTGSNVNGGFQLRNYWGGHGGINRNYDALSTTRLRGGPAILTPGRTSTFFGFYSDRRKRIGVSLNGGASMEDDTEGYTWRLGPELELRPSSRMEVSLAPSLNRNLDPWQFIAGIQSLDDRPHYVFGRLDQTTVALTTRLSYAFTPDLSLQFYAQPFVSAGEFSEFRAVRDPRAERFDDRLPIFADDLDELFENPETGLFEADSDGDDVRDVTLGNPDFNVKQLRSNAVLRWQYRPGSTLFVVWSQGRTGFAPDGSFDLWGDAGELFGAPGTNTLLVKLSYWFGM